MSGRLRKATGPIYVARLRAPDARCPPGSAAMRAEPGRLHATKCVTKYGADVGCAAASLTLGLLTGKPEPSHRPRARQAAVPGSR
jgi:hypothetical protein